ncbi:hypothetical protein G7Y89_g11590 [Cudoniella acicularis]|uniref:Uncharacterized protein n=1 Tax=Cudoniella acicularis TaxID=354080 RepID=A0A8H4RDF8_9HELO|nr:hypothetical protein G7Y89_g11590 [Cudoniella acicularis]
MQSGRSRNIRRKPKRERVGIRSAGIEEADVALYEQHHLDFDPGPMTVQENVLQTINDTSRHLSSVLRDLHIL